MVIVFVLDMRFVFVYLNVLELLMGKVCNNCKICVYSDKYGIEVIYIKIISYF